MKAFVFLALIIAAAACGATDNTSEGATAASDDASANNNGFVSLFDGETLNGWTGDPRYWAVEDGAIVGKVDEPLEVNTFLIREGSYSDFEVRLKYRLPSEISNSGLQYRSRPDPENEYSVIGYQANIVTKHADRTFSMLWDENARDLLANYGDKAEIVKSSSRGGASFETRVVDTVNEKSFIMDAQKPYPAWNEYTVIAYGNRLVHILNGVVALDVVDNDPEGRALSGQFALQIHRDLVMEAQFKDIEVRSLTDEPNINARFVTIARAAKN